MNERSLCDLCIVAIERKIKLQLNKGCSEQGFLVVKGDGAMINRGTTLLSDRRTLSTEIEARRQ